MTPLGQRLTWRRKLKGTNACRRSGNCLKTCVGRGSRDPRDMAKAELLEPQSPAKESDVPPITTSVGRGRQYRALSKTTLEASGWRAAGNDPAQGDERGAYVTLARPLAQERGIAVEARASRRRSLRSSPRAGKPSTWRREAGVFDYPEREVREMRNAETILGVIRERGRQGLPLERVYRLLFSRELFLLAYGKIARNRGALTPGATKETVDGMSLAKIDAIIGALRFERYRWTPARRVYIEKQGSMKKRPLGLPTWSDKLLQEVIRIILDAYYEPQFSARSHGFRPGRGCHTALTEVHEKWDGSTWFIEGDIAQCFDRLDHAVLLAILGERICNGGDRPHGHPGLNTWRNAGVRPWSSAKAAMRLSTTEICSSKRNEALESRMIGNGQVRFGGGPTEKACT
jgi:hypothetical protein